jgi:hypothetical protein
MLKTMMSTIDTTIQRFFFDGSWDNDWVATPRRYSGKNKKQSKKKNKVLKNFTID